MSNEVTVQVNYLHVIGQQQVEIIVLKERIAQLEQQLNGGQQPVVSDVGEQPVVSVE